MKTIVPGSTIGILGGGQLARMTALAAARLGYPCHIFCPSAEEPALQVTPLHTIAAYTDGAALKAFASAVDVVTLEWENIPLSALEIIGKKIALHPSLEVMRTAQDRILEKTFARKIGIGTADFLALHSAGELAKALKTFPLPAVLKSARMGYDGKGQVKITPGTDAEKAWKEMGGETGILEAFVDFSCEVSVIVARREDGTTAVYPTVENIHRDHILAETHAPARVGPVVAAEARQIASELADELKVVGLLAVEMFVLKKPNAEGQRVLMNEMAPRPHNSGHWTIDACATSQFEQLVRAICGLPLGSPAPHSRAVMQNLLGHDIERWSELLKKPRTCLHLYGKAETRKGRKMGHVTYLKGAW
jgi:5-(carboxyamino)imidazole ribonucleotide synthase